MLDIERKSTYSIINGSKCPVDCEIQNIEIKGIGNFLEVVNAVISEDANYWFRGHSNLNWTLIPTALRFKTVEEREKALSLLGSFKQIAEIKLRKPPRDDEYLKWLQIAQHYGLPTRLLDWTESALFALYFACEKSNMKSEEDGIIYLMNPEHLNKLAKAKLKIDLLKISRK